MSYDFFFFWFLDFLLDTYSHLAEHQCSAEHSLENAGLEDTMQMNSYSYEKNSSAVAQIYNYHYHHLLYARYLYLYS